MKRESPNKPQPTQEPERISDESAGDNEMDHFREIEEKYQEGGDYEKRIRAQINSLPEGRIPEDEKHIIEYLLGRLDEVEVFLFPKISLKS